MTLSQTRPVTGPGPDAFASLPFVDGKEDGQPFVPTTPEAPRVTSPEDAKAMGMAVGKYFVFGVVMLANKNPAALRGLSQAVSIDELAKRLPDAEAFVAGCAERCALKYNLRLPYVDEIVAVGAIGIATAGIAMKPKNENAEPVRPPPSPSAPSSPRGTGGRTQPKRAVTEEDVFTPPQDMRDVFEAEEDIPGVTRMPRDGEEDLDPKEPPVPNSDEWHL